VKIFLNRKKVFTSYSLKLGQ